MKRYFKIRVCVAYMLMVVLLLQSCTAYKKTTGSFEEAVATETKRVKAIKPDGSKQIIKGIRKTDSLYYGMVRAGGKKTKIRLNEGDYNKIYLQDKEYSTLLTVGLVSVGVLSAILIGLSSPYSKVSNSLHP